MQSKILIYLHKKKFNDSIYRDYSSSNSNINENYYNIDKNSDKKSDKLGDNNILEVENNIDFNLKPDENDNNGKLKLLKKLLAKNNLKLNKELKDNVNEYYSQKNKMNQLLNISKKNYQIN